MVGLYVEETLPNDGRYQIVWKDGAPEEAMDFLLNHRSENRLELWSKGHAETCKGFCPLAFRAVGSDQVRVSSTFKMLALS